MKEVLRAARCATPAQQDSHLSLDHLIIALLDSSPVNTILAEHQLSKARCQQLVDDLRQNEPITGDQAEEQYDALSKYGHDLVQMAEDGKLDPVIGREGNSPGYSHLESPE